MAEDFQDCWRGIDCCAGDRFSLSEAGFAGFWGIFGMGGATRTDACSGGCLTVV